MPSLDGHAVEAIFRHHEQSSLCYRLCKLQAALPIGLERVSIGLPLQHH
jgi:hypothetical protein